MERVEVRHNKKVAMPVTVGFFLFSLIFTYIFFTDDSKVENFVSNCIGGIVSIFVLAATLYELIVLYKNIPALLFEKNQLVITHYKTPIYISWSDIISWEIERDDDIGTPYLVIKKDKSKIKLNISGLEKSPDQIDELMMSFWVLRSNLV